MSEVLFKSVCLAAGCDDEEECTWHHSECPSSSKEYLSDQGIVRCEYCGKSWEFFEITFKCSSRNNLSLKPNLKRALYALAILEDSKKISEDFYYKIKNSLKEQWKKYNY